MEAEGRWRKRKRRYRDPACLPPCRAAGDLAAGQPGRPVRRPLEWQGEGAAPRILIIRAEGRPGAGRGRPHSGPLTEVKGEDHAYEARLIRGSASTR
jgi:ribonuclease R